MTGIVQRKSDHIDIVLNEDVSMSTPTGFGDYRFVHQALPEIAFDDITTDTEFLGHALGAPLLISSMTGGNEEAGKINRNLAEAAAELRIPMAVGSQRVLIERPEALESFRAAREAASGVPLFGNIGAVQLNKGVTADDIQRTIDLLGADGIFLHLNPLQEIVQAGGDTDFSDLLHKIELLVDRLSCPVLIKEVGCGVDPALAVRLAEVGVAAVDVSGAGGTSWASIEARRATDERQRRLGEVFNDWGIPTVECLTGARVAAPELPLIASGGVKTGLDVAKAVTLGADLTGFAMPLLKPASISADAVVEHLEQILYELRATMFLTGADSLASLKANRHRLLP